MREATTTSPAALVREFAEACESLAEAVGHKDTTRAWRVADWIEGIAKKYNHAIGEGAPHAAIDGRRVHGFCEPIIDRERGLELGLTSAPLIYHSSEADSNARLAVRAPMGVTGILNTKLIRQMRDAK